ncbi:MAG: UDP-glucose 4-epimerase [Chloroflexi bacterium]|nr:UDP-glucose 4-epimerase [Chloroflexota bacterium]
MNILVCGGAGYIGSACARVLLEAGHRVTVYDALLTGHRAAVPREAYFVEANLADGDRLQRTLGEGRFEAVMHFAAFIEAGESMRDPGKYFLNNIGNSLALVEAASRAGIPRLVFSSTAAVYASSDEPLHEESPLGPSNVYGQTKLMIEQVLEWYARTRGLRYAALRYFNAAGALPGMGEDHPDESHLIPLVLRVALGQRPHAEIYGSDEPRLVYNLGNGSGYSVREVIEVARRVTGHPIHAVESPRRAGDAARLVASSEKIRRELGWAPRHPHLDDIVRSAWEWHRTHPKGYSPE